MRRESASSAPPGSVAVDGVRAGLYNRRYGGPPVIDHTSPVSDLLRAWGQGDARARDDLLPLVYAELRAQAVRYMRRERRARLALSSHDAGHHRGAG
jgi:hypothetical protein